MWFTLSSVYLFFDLFGGCGEVQLRAVMAERQNAVFCSFDSSSPRITAYEIHEWIHTDLRIQESTVSMILIDGTKRQAFIKFVDNESVHALLRDTAGRAEYKYPSGYISIVNIQVSHELRSLLRESVSYVKICRYNTKHLCPKLNGYGDNGQRKELTSCISAYCTSSAVSALTLTEQCSRHLCECTSSAQRDKIVLHYCQIVMRYVQCLVTLRTTMT